MQSDKTQLDKFKEAARQLETDDDEERFEARLRGIVKPRSLTDGPDSDSVGKEDGGDG